LQQLLQAHSGPQVRPLAKHSQYSLRHFDFEQLHFEVMAVVLEIAAEETKNGVDGEGLPNFFLICLDSGCGGELPLKVLETPGSYYI
jgi:hypothetical protein